MDKSLWNRFFDHHAGEYMYNIFTKNTEFEVEFIIKELGLKPGQRVLDVGCGTGRHSIPLSRWGARMTGIDLSEGMLSKARDYAGSEGASLELIRADAASLNLPDRFDHAICLCEGALGLLGEKEDPIERDFSILKNISRCLKPGARFLLTVLNGLKKVREHSQEDVATGRFDPVNLVSYDKVAIIESGKEKETVVREKGFAPAELILLMKQAGFTVLHLWGGTAGSWNKKVLDPDEYEIMVLAQKTLPVHDYS